MAKNCSSCINTEIGIQFDGNDNLDWNQKKHDMILNLGLTNNSEADQTPTPTRFIRNCEEVGLFQDLQNVNPFDEVFKKAVENPTGVCLQIPVTSSDDTLHTPQIYPQLEGSLKLPNTDISTPSNCLPRDEAENSLIIIESKKGTDIPNTDKQKTDASSQPEASTLRDMRVRIKAAIIKKSAGVTPVPLDQLLDHEKKNEKNGSQDHTDMAILIRQREANKAAQSRCRKRKQIEFEEIKAENKFLKKENFKLTSMNVYLQDTIKKLLEEIKEAKSSNSVSSGLPTKSLESCPSIDSGILTVSIGQVNKETNCQEMSQSTSIISHNVNVAVVSSLEDTSLQNNQNTISPSCSTILQNPVATSHSKAPVILSKLLDKDKILSTPIKPSPITPTTVVVSLPVQNQTNSIGMPVNGIQNNLNTVVLVYPPLPQTSLLPSNDTILLHQDKHFKRIMPK